MTPGRSSVSGARPRTRVRNGGSRPRAPGGRGGRDGLAGSLSAVSDALVTTARGRAESERERAEEYARTVVAEARSQSQRIVDDARAEGAAAAARIASLRMAVARREAREIVLGARRHAYETLRRCALDALAGHLASPEGRQLAQRLSQLVRQRLHGAVATSRPGREGLTVQARSGNRICVVGPDLLVDQVLSQMADDLESLWN